MSELLEECVERAKPPGRPASKPRNVRIFPLRQLAAGGKDYTTALVRTLRKQL